MKALKPLVNRTYLLEKFPGKGGWTHALIPEIKPHPNRKIESQNLTNGQPDLAIPAPFFSLFAHHRPICQPCPFGMFIDQRAARTKKLK